MAHGGGGRLMQDLIADIFARAFEGGTRNHDAAVLAASSQELAFTTDSYVVQPLFFPGGDIGSLAIHGTVNDLAMAGARARAISAGFILEEGLETQRLWDVACSMGRAARKLNVPIVTGDTKVIDVGKGDGLYINTSGVGDVITARPRPHCAGRRRVGQRRLGPTRHRRVVRTRRTIVRQRPDE